MFCKLHVLQIAYFANCTFCILYVLQITCFANCPYHKLYVLQIAGAANRHGKTFNPSADTFCLQLKFPQNNISKFLQNKMNCSENHPLKAENVLNIQLLSHVRSFLHVWLQIMRVANCKCYKLHVLQIANLELFFRPKIFLTHNF